MSSSSGPRLSTIAGALSLLALALSACSTRPVSEPYAERVDLVVAGGTVVTMDASLRVIENGAVAVRGDRIAAVGPADEVRRRFIGRDFIPAEGAMILPGLINSHNHAPMVLFRGIADDMKLMEWLQSFIFPAEARNVTAEFVEWGTLLACLEMIQSGTTTYADMYYFEDRVAEATARAGMRGVLGETIIQFPAPDNRSPEEALAYTERFIERWKGHPLVTPAVAPHAPYTNSAETLRAARALADRHGVPLILHVSETREETAQILAQHGTTPARWLDRLGVLGPDVVFNHGVWLSEEDIDLLRARGVGVTHNPESNMKLASGTAPVPRLLAMGVAVGLGTDGAASNNDLDMFEAMDFAAKLQKLASMDPTTLPAPAVVEMATIGGARALGMDASIGSLEEGKKADLIVMSVGGSHAIPIYNVYSHIVYALKGSDVRTSVINGKVVMRDRRVLTLNEREIQAKAAEFQRRIQESLR